MTGRSYGTYGMPSSSYSFGSSYISGPSYHISSGYTSSASRILSGFGSSALPSSFSSSFDLPRPKSFGVKPALHYPSPCRIIKPSFMPSISEGHVFNTRPTPPPPSAYRPLPTFTPLSVPSSTTTTSSGAGFRRMNVRDTANIDVVNRPASRIEHTQPKPSNNNNNPTGPTEASRPPAYSTAIQRDFTVGTLKRGRQVIRLQTTRLPSPESIAKQEESKRKEEPKRVALAVPNKPAAPLTVCEEQEEAPPVKTKPAIRAYGGAERMPLLPLTPASPADRKKMTPGEKLKEKYMVLSRKGPKKSTLLHQRLPMNIGTTPAVPIAVPPVATLSKDSGLGSSPVVTAPTSFRDPKLAEASKSTSQQLLFICLEHSISCCAPSFPGTWVVVWGVSYRLKFRGS